MIKRIIIIYIFLFSIQIEVKSDENKNCKWDNNKKIPCVEINTYLPNSSKLSKKGINKIVIGKKKIIDSGAVDIVDVMNLVSEVNITQSGGRGQQASLFMRGTGSNHTLVMINGIPINDQSTTQGLHDFGVDFIQTIQQIEIYPGSSAAHFGSNAIGGAINLVITGDLKESLLVSSDINNNFDLSINKNFSYKTSLINLKMGHANFKEISSMGNKKHDEKDGVKNYTLNLNYENFLNDKSRIFSNNYLRRTISDYDNSALNQTDYESDNVMASFQFGLDKFAQEKKSKYVIYNNIYDREYDERGTVDFYKSGSFGIKYDRSSLFSENFSLGYGTDYRYDYGKFNNNGAYSASTKGYSDNFSVYANFGLNLSENFTLSLFTRSENHRETGDNLTQKINIHNLNDKFSYGLSYMNGLRNPTLYELYGTDNYGYSGNRYLKPEKSSTLELYADYDVVTNFKISFNAFKSNIKNNIEYVSNKYINDSDDVDLNQSGIISKILLKSSTTKLDIFSSLLNSKKENGSTQLRRPEKTYGFDLSKKIKKTIIGKINLNLNYNHYGSHYDTDSLTFKTIKMDSSDLINLKIQKEINNSHFFIKISNLLNENFQQPHGYNQEDRNIYFGIKY